MIRDNVIHGGGTGIDLDYYRGEKYENVVIKSNRIMARDYGIEIGPTKHVEILRNEICLPQWYGVYFAAQNSQQARVEDNRVFCGSGEVVLGAVPTDEGSRVRNNVFAIQACGVP